MRRFETNESTQVAAIEYNGDYAEMLVEFRNGSSYIYSDVPLEDFGKIVSAPSVGGAFSFFKALNKTFRRVK